MNKILISLLFLASSAPAQAPAGDVLVTVNGQPIRRDDVMNRLWALHAVDALNQLVDDALAGQALAGFESRANAKDKQAWRKEADQRLAAVRSQFKNEAAFAENLRRAGATLDGLRQQIWAQLLREKAVIAAAQITVTPAEVKGFFDANKDKLGDQGGVRVRHIVVPTEQQARDLLVSIRVGADFARLAQQLSLDAGSKERGGDLGFISRGVLAPEIEGVVFALKPGEVSEVVKTDQGFHLFKVEERRQPKPVSFGDVEKDLRRALLAQKINQAWPAYLAEARRKSQIQPAPGLNVGAPAAR